MVMRTPRSIAGEGRNDNLDALQYEILQEKAAVLARLSRKLQASIEALEAFDGAAHPASAAAERDALVGAAGEALWYYVIQREVLGLPGTEAVLHELRVPREVRLRMGLNRRTSEPKPGGAALPPGTKDVWPLL